MYALVIGALAALLLLGLAARRKDPLKLRMVLGILLSLSLLLIGMNVQARWLFFLSSLLLAAVISSYLVARFSLRGLEVARQLPAELTEGEAAPVRLSVRNRGRLARRLFLLVDEGWKGPGGVAGTPAAPPAAAGEGRLSQRLLTLAGRGLERDREAVGGPVPLDRDVKVFVPRLEPAQDSELRVPRLFSARGIFSGGRITLRSGGWIGLASSRRAVHVPESVTVLPRYVELAWFPALEDFQQARRVRMDDRPNRSSADFYGIRDYRQGDPLRHVHWRSTARAGQLMVREFEREPGSLLSVLVINERGTDVGPWGDTLLDNAARIAASLLFYAVRSGRPSRLAFARGDRFILHGPDGFDAARAELAGLADDGALAPAEMARRAGEGVPAGSCLVTVAPSYRCDLAGLAGSVPRGVGAGLVLLDAASFDPALPGEGLFPPDQLEGWAASPPPGFSFCLLFRKGDDLETCLQTPLPITSA